MRSLLVLLLCFPLASCGTFFVGFVSNPGGATSVNGTVGVVILGSSEGPAGSTTSTAVTFINPGTGITISFCGDQRNLFPVGQDVQADFISGPSCSVLTKVVIIP